eukprot:2832022-Pyramimonas_sp.AAC.1
MDAGPGQTLQAACPMGPRRPRPVECASGRLLQSDGLLLGWLVSLDVGLVDGPHAHGKPPQGVVLMRRWERICLWARPSVRAAVLPGAGRRAGLARGRGELRDRLLAAVWLAPCPS